MTSDFQQREQGIFVYPGSGWRRAFMKAPLVCWRLGLEPLLRPMHFIVVTTRGRNSGQPRHTMLEHSYVNGNIYIAPGWGHRTQWFLNILACPRITVQRNGRTFGAIARLVTDSDELTAVYHNARGRSPVWKQFLASWGIEDTPEDLLAKKDRIPTLRLDPIEAELPLPPLKADLVWVWPVLILAVIGVHHFLR